MTRSTSRTLVAPALFLATLLATLLATAPAWAQAPITYQQTYDAAGQLTSVVDSTGVIVQYVYDTDGNLVQITRSAASGPLSILSFSPASGAPGTAVTIEGAGFSTTAAANTVNFNGVAATVTSASANTLIVTVPATASTGAISVATGGNTVASVTSFTVIAVPVITSINPPYLVTGQSLATIVVVGTNLTGATFSFQPAAIPAAITITNAVVTSTTATLSVNAGPNVASAVVVATNGSGSSGVFANSANTVSILNSAADSDGDGLTNLQEIGLMEPTR